MSDGQEDEDVTVRVRPNLSVERLEAAAKAPEVPDPPAVAVERPETATARAAFGETLPASPANRGAMMGVALIGSLVGGATTGFLIDKVAGNSGTPWGFIVGSVLGLLLGFVLVQQLGRSMSQ